VLTRLLMKREMHIQYNWGCPCLYRLVFQVANLKISNVSSGWPISMPLEIENQPEQISDIIVLHMCSVLVWLSIHSEK